jgi:hypothetical protein
VPSVLRRSAGFDVPDFLAAGPRDVLVPDGGAGAARELLGAAGLGGGPAAASPRGWAHPARLLAAVTGGALAAAGLAWALLG